MPLAAGDKLGPYEILAPIGKGGMGEVYRARDPRLNRDVAIKVSAERFSERFEREAKAIAALNHPNICQIYDVGASPSGLGYLVMELVEGPTLAERISAGAIPLEESLKVARQIAEALGAAHDKGIVHRDLKPANIKFTPEAKVKVLDFGLAKLSPAAAGPTTENSPTLTMAATQAGVVLGTAAYMSPEQARGKPVDKRADIWAFGVVLYEMLTGKRLFEGDDLTETLASVLKQEPRLDDAPFEVRRLLKKCLQKDPAMRLRDIGDVWELLAEEPLPGGPGSEAEPRPKGAVLWPSVAAAAILALAVLAFIHFREQPRPLQLQRFAIPSPDATVAVVPILSPDGARLLLAGGPGTGKLWLRRMDSLETHLIEGADGASGIPFWSPDSRFIVFAAENKLKKVDVEGGPPQILCDMGQVLLGGSWTPDGRIVFSDPNRRPGLFQVPAAGGTASPLPAFSQAPATQGEVSPVLLPDGRHFIYSQASSQPEGLYLASLDAKANERPRKLLSGAGYVVAVALSPEDRNLAYLLFIRTAAGVAPATGLSGPLMAQPFDLRKLDLAGEAVPIAPQAAEGSFSASTSGALAYSPGALVTGVELTLFDRAGKVAGTAGERGPYDTTMVISPDGSRILAPALDTQSGKRNLWMFDLARGVRTRFTSAAPDDFLAVWSPDGSRVVYGSMRGAQRAVYQKLSNGGGEEELFFKAADYGALPLDWSGDGRYMIVGNESAAAATTYILSLDQNGRPSGDPKLFVRKGLGIEERFSPAPQGRPQWIAYQSNQSGRWEVYARPFDPNSPTGTPPGGAEVQISSGGGVSPRWNRNGKELFYVQLDGTSGTVMSVDLSKGVERPATPKALFKVPGWTSGRYDVAYWDASRDGQKFLFAVAPSASSTSAPEPVTVVLNWTQLLKR